MSDIAQGPGWWQASDGKWYPPDLHPDAARPAGWWLASDGNWYPPEAHPDARQSSAPASSAPTPGTAPEANLPAPEDQFGSPVQAAPGFGGGAAPGWPPIAEDTWPGAASPSTVYGSVAAPGAGTASRPVWRRPLVLISVILLVIAAGIAIPLALHKSKTPGLAATSLSPQALLSKTLAAAAAASSVRITISTTVNGQSSSTETLNLNPKGSIAAVNDEAGSFGFGAIGATNYLKGPAATLTSVGLSTLLANRYAGRWMSARNLPGSTGLTAQLLDKSAELEILQLNGVTKIASEVGTIALRGQLRASTLIPSELAGSVASLKVSSGAPYLPVELSYTSQGATVNYGFSAWGHVAAAAAPKGAVPFEPILVESASGPTTGLEHVLQEISIRQSDLAPGLTLELIGDGDQVAGQVTLDLCSQTYQSESYRVARRQLAVAQKNGATTVISTEAVVYTNALAAASAISEVEAAEAHCPSGYEVPAEGPPAIRTVIDPTPDASWPAVAGVQRFGVSATINLQTGQTVHTYEIFIVRGRILLGIYVSQNSQILPFTIGGATSIESLTELLEHRLAALPASAAQ